MGSVTRRIKRNIWAANMAEKAGIKAPPVRLPVDPEDPSKGTFLFWSKFTPRINYRATMLRVLRARKQRDKTLHHIEQKRRSRQDKLDKRYKDSFLKRAFKGLFGRSA